MTTSKDRHASDDSSSNPTRTGQTGARAQRMATISPSRTMVRNMCQNAVAVSVHVLSDDSN
eukprot:9468217-Pyramimonas_sp.AAC.1